VEGDNNPLVESLQDVPISFSRDGNHYTYMTDFSPEHGWEHVHRLVVDGKIDPPAYTVPGFAINPYMQGKVAPLITGDSRHLLTVRNKKLPSPERRGEFVNGPLTIFLDQKPVLEAPSVDRLVSVPTGPYQSKKISRRYYADLIDLWVAPAGSNLIAVFALPNEDPTRSSDPSGYRLFFNDRKVVDVPKLESITWSGNGGDTWRNAEQLRGPAS
jgi:hypothetical protein